MDNLVRRPDNSERHVMKKQLKPLKQKNTERKRFSWVIRAADRRGLVRQPAGNCACK